MAAAVVGRLNNLIDVCRRLHITIIFTQHGHPLLDPEAEERSSVLVRWWGADGSIRHGSHAWQLLPELHVKPGEDPIISTKQTYDAFQGTELLELLQKHDCDTLVIGGVMTNLCCETTARSSFTKNFEVLFLSDGTATASKEMHDASLLNLSYGFARVLTCAEAEQELKRSCSGGDPPA